MRIMQVVRCVVMHILTSIHSIIFVVSSQSNICLTTYMKDVRHLNHPLCMELYPEINYNELACPNFSKLTLLLSPSFSKHI